MLLSYLFACTLAVCVSIQWRVSTELVHIGFAGVARRPSKTCFIPHLLKGTADCKGTAGVLQGAVFGLRGWEFVNTRTSS